MSYDDPKVSEVIAELGTAFTEFKRENERRLDEIELKAGRARFAGATGSSANADLVQAKAALADFMRGDVATKSTASGMRVAIDPAGGYVVNAVLSDAITSVIRETSPIRRAGARVETIDTGDALEELLDKDDLNAVWVGEVGTRPSTATPDLAKWRIEAHEMSCEPKATQQLLEDANRDIAAWLVAKAGDRFGRLENASFLNGNGVGQPRGLMTYPTAATSDASRAWGTFEHIATGNSGALATTNPADTFLDAIDRMKPSYRPGSVWLMPRTLATSVRKIKTTQGEYIWQPSMQAGQPSMLFGYPIFECEDMAAPASGSLSAVFVNLNRTYVIVDRLATQIMRDVYTQRPYVVFACRRRVGGGVINTETAKMVKFATS